jgi:hypothetical protein
MLFHNNNNDDDNSQIGMVYVNKQLIFLLTSS